MKFTIGKQTIEAQVVSQGTTISKKSGIQLRTLTVRFTLSGMDISKRYSAIIQEAKANGIVSGGSDQEELVSWTVYDLGGTSGYSSLDVTLEKPEPSPWNYVLWELTEKEKE